MHSNNRSICHIPHGKLSKTSSDLSMFAKVTPIGRHVCIWVCCIFASPSKLRDWFIANIVRLETRVLNTVLSPISASQKFFGKLWKWSHWGICSSTVFDNRSWKQLVACTLLLWKLSKWVLPIHSHSVFLSLNVLLKNFVFILIAHFLLASNSAFLSAGRDFLHIIILSSFFDRFTPSWIRTVDHFPECRWYQ